MTVLWVTITFAQNVDINGIVNKYKRIIHELNRQRRFSIGD